MTPGILLRQAAFVACALLSLALPHAALAQARAFSASSIAAVGANPTAIAYDPVTRKLYVTNNDDDTVSILATDTAGAHVIGTIPVGHRPNHVAVNTETDTVYVSNESDGTMTVIDARTNQVRSTAIVVVSGAMALSPFDNHMYMLRSGFKDEFNVIIGDSFLQSDAIRSYAPLGLAVNPVTNRLFIATQATSDVVAHRLDDSTDYPIRECPDGHGGFVPDSGSTNPDPAPCMDVPGYPVNVAVNPTNNRIYALSSTGEVSVIQGPGMTWTSAVPAGAGSGAVAIAVNPVANIIYALYQDRILLLRGSDMSVILSRDLPSTGVGLTVDVKRNLVFVAMTGGQVMWIGSDLAGTNSGTVTVSADTRGIVFDPVSMRAFVLTSTGISALTASGDFPASAANPLQAAVRAAPSNTVATSGSFTIDASSSMSPAPLDQVRAVFYRVVAAGGNDGTAAFLKATRNADGSWSAPYAGLAERGSYVLEYYATNGLDMTVTNTDKVSVPLASAAGSYAFSTGSPILTRRLVDFDNDGKGDISWRNNDGSVGLWLMNGSSAGATGGLVRPAPTARIVQLADFDGDGKTDVLWRADGGVYYVSLMNGLAQASTAMIYPGGEPWEVVGTFERDGSGGRDLLWRHPTQGFAFWTMQGTQPTSGGSLSAPAAGLQVALTGDFSASGIDVPVWTHPDGRTYVDGTLVLPAGTGWTPKFLGDFNGDKRKDILWRNADGSWGLWLMNGATPVNGVTLVGARSGYEVAFVRDLDGDGQADLLWRRADGSYEAWLMNGVQVKARGVILPAGSGWTLMGSDDYDGDGKFDLLWRRDATGEYGIWLMNGLQPVGGSGNVVPAFSGWEAAP